MNYEGFLKLENTIKRYIYPYPAFLSYSANNRIGETREVEFSEGKRILEIKNGNNADNDPTEHKKREECLYQALRQFQNKTNNDLRLKQIQQEHLECAEKIVTKYHKAMNNTQPQKNKGTKNAEKPVNMANNLAQHGFHSRSGYPDENSNFVEKINLSKTC